MPNAQIEISETYYRDIARNLLAALCYGQANELKDAFSQLSLVKPSEYDDLISAIANLRKEALL